MNETIDLKNAKEEFTKALKGTFKEKVTHLGERGKSTNVETTFSLEFKCYGYFDVVLHFKNGEIYFSVFNTKDTEGIRLRNNQSHYENLNMASFLEEFQQEIELRIPDKFLINRGWK